MNLENTFKAVQNASRKLRTLSNDRINEILNAVASEISIEIPYILRENERDLEKMDLSDPKYDRLRLTAERLESIAADIRNVATLPLPLGRVLAQREQNGRAHG